MTSSTLYREGDDLDTLLTALTAEYGPTVRVLAVDEERAGGWRGLFGRPRVCVQFRLDDGERAPETADPLADLLAAADAGDTELSAPRHAIEQPRADNGSESNGEFAAMLRELAAAKGAQRTAARPRPRPRPGPGRSAAAPVASAEPVAVALPATAPDAALSLRRRLAELGVPMHLLPATATDPARAVQTVVAALPEAPLPPVGRGGILALAGPATRLAEALRELVDDLHVDPERVWTVGLPATAFPGALRLRDAWDAATAAQRTRARLDRLVVVAVATDGAPSRNRTRLPAEILAALSPDALWAVVEATHKPADVRNRLAGLGPVTAAVVVDAAETASPATVLELGLPVARLDGEVATPQRWAAALLTAYASRTSC